MGTCTFFYCPWFCIFLDEVKDFLSVTLVHSPLLTTVVKLSLLSGTLFSSELKNFFMSCRTLLLSLPLSTGFQVQLRFLTIEYSSLEMSEQSLGSLSSTSCAPKELL
jgi:hypothetical protein